MHKKLLIEAFEKVKTEHGFTKKTHTTEFLSDYINESSGEPYGEKILRIHYNNAIANTEEKVELKQFAVVSLCNYLGYNDFSSYTKKNQISNQILKLSFFAKHKVKLLTTASLVVIVFLLSSLTVNTQKWMVWQNNQYQEVEFNTEKYSLNQLKLFKEERIHSFKKVVLPCDTVFFNDDKSPKFWYGKNNKKEIEFFTALALHPQTGKTLKPLTRYMINKYICK